MVASSSSSSVPTFDEPSHVRHFKNWQAVMQRYARFIDLHTVKWQAIWKWFLFTAKRKTNEDQTTQKANDLFDGLYHQASGQNGQ